MEGRGKGNEKENEKKTVTGLQFVAYACVQKKTKLYVVFPQVNFGEVLLFF